MSSNELLKCTAILSTKVHLRYIAKYVLVGAIIKLCEANLCSSYTSASSCQCGSGPATFTYRFNNVGNIKLTDDDIDDYGYYTKDQKVSSRAGNLNEQSNFYQSTLPTLNLLSLEGSNLQNFTSNSFYLLANSTLKSLNMRSVSITNVENDALELVRNSLINLDLANAKVSLKNLAVLIESLCTRRHACSSTLINLGLANMSLNKVPFEVLKPIRCSLKALSLFGNNFETNRVQRAKEILKTRAASSGGKMPGSVVTPADFVPPELDIKTSDKEPHWATFPVMSSLLELDLRSCRINYIRNGFFVNFPNLKVLRMSHNNILILPPFAFQGLRNLLVLDMSYNRYESIRLIFRQGITLRNNSFAGLESLKVLNLTESVIAQTSFEFLNGLPPSLEKLSLCRTGLVMLEDKSFGELSNLRVLDLSHNFGLGTEFTSQTFAGLNALQELHLPGTALRDLSFVTNLKSLTVLNVRCNNLVYLEGLFSSFANLTTLDLSFNFITSWNQRIFTQNGQLSIVLLHFNALNVVTTAMLSDFKSLNYLSIGNNRLICNCNLKEFIEYARIKDYTVRQNTAVTIDYQKLLTHVCLDTETLESVSFSDTNEFCKDEVTKHRLSGLGHAVYITILTLMTISSVGGLVYWKWWYIRYFAVLIKNTMILRIISSENYEGKIYVYDMFVSYSNENRNWVIQELLPNLEESHSRLSVCLHERDFQIGVSIIENIITGMDQSKTLLLIISNSFLKSQWCQFEMHLAQHRLLEMCREELILVLLEEIPRRKKPKILQYLMMTKTYIVWPKDDKDELAREMFWKRLKKAIAITSFRAKQYSTA